MATITPVQIDPQHYGHPVTFKKRYGNFIGGEWVAPVGGQYFENITPVTGKVLCEIPRSGEADIEKALDAATKAKRGWAKTSVTERSNILLKIAQRIEDNVELLAAAETWDNGKPIRETTAADVPLSADQFRYFAGAIRAQQ
ncbi:aldehyde dehydrogenase family protein, partial [Silvibacterium sp.]|uniref:aldehyde dehydrogenase family protein n=1 Tax=Silvibacterium sp. TaxID=1964179 RepID=UPI0039E51D09